MSQFCFNYKPKSIEPLQLDALFVGFFFAFGFADCGATAVFRIQLYPRSCMAGLSSHSAGANAICKHGQLRCSRKVRLASFFIFVNNHEEYLFAKLPVMNMLLIEKGVFF